MSEELKSCPFCGQPPKEAKRYIPGDYWYLGCYDERHGVIEFQRPSKEEAIAAWNHRSEPPRREAEGLRDMEERRAFKEFCDGNRAPWVERILAAVSYRMLMAGAERRETEQRVTDKATLEIIGKAEAAMNLAASYLNKAAEAGDPSALHQRNRLIIAAGALARLQSLPPSVDKVMPAPKCPVYPDLCDGKHVSAVPPAQACISDYDEECPHCEAKEGEVPPAQECPDPEAHEKGDLLFPCDHKPAQDCGHCPVCDGKMFDFNAHYWCCQNCTYRVPKASPAAPSDAKGRERP